MLLDVFSVVGDAAGSDAWLPHQLEAYLPAQEVWDLAFLSNTQQPDPISAVVCFICGKINTITVTDTNLPLLIDLTEQLLHVREILVLRGKQSLFLDEQCQKLTLNSAWMGARTCLDWISLRLC